MPNQYRIRSSSWSISPRVVAFVGREGISELYRFEVGVSWSTEVPFAPEEVVGDAITLEIVSESGTVHAWHGVVADISLVLEEGPASYWRVSFGPRLRTLARKETVTLVYSAHDEAHNDAIVLQDVLLHAGAGAHDG